MNTEKFLPIGTVVMLNGGAKRVMITGFCTVADDDKSKIIFNKQHIKIVVITLCKFYFFP